MKKGRSNNPSPRPPSESRRLSRAGARFTLPKSKILRGRKNFQRLFEETATVFTGTNLNIRFRLYSADKPDCKMAFIVPKRLGKAVQRNRMKRLLKEAYRLNQFIIVDGVSSASHCFHGAFMAKTVGLEYDEVETDVIALLDRVQNHIRNITVDTGK